MTKGQQQGGPSQTLIRQTKSPAKTTKNRSGTGTVPVGPRKQGKPRQLDKDFGIDQNKGKR